jgi:hypothetical protein
LISFHRFFHVADVLLELAHRPIEPLHLILLSLLRHPYRWWLTLPNRLQLVAQFQIGTIGKFVGVGVDEGHYFGKRHFQNDIKITNLSST